MAGLVCAPAEFSLGADATVYWPLPSAPPAALPVPEQSWATFAASPYVVAAGQPTAPPPMLISLATVCALGAFDIDDTRPAPADAVTGADYRWLPTPASYLGGVWTPSVGPAELTFTAEPVYAPELVGDYSYATPHGEVPAAALCFDAADFAVIAGGGEWFSSAATLALLAVIHAPIGTSAVGLLEVDPPGEDPGWGMRYRAGGIELYADATLLHLPLALAPGRPVLAILAVDAAGARLTVLARSRGHATAAVGSVAQTGLGLLLGRRADASDAATGAVIDVLEVDLWDRALDAAEIDAVAHTLDHVYGISG